MANMADIAPRHGGKLFGLCNTFGEHNKRPACTAADASNILIEQQLTHMDRCIHVNT